MNHISDQPKPEEIILPSIREAQVSEFGIDGGETGTDELFNEAVSLVITHQQGSISLLQRRLKVGYSRAARLIDEMEQTGVVGPFTGSKAREVLVDETYLEMIRDS
jgi:S-DNA-T family DNA segregation ATPase FtsK/SpoIIIE